MDVTERDSGLIVPYQKPAPHRVYGALEIVNEQMRADTRKALQGLWNAAGLRDGGGGIMPNRDIDESRRDLVIYVEEQLLGKDSSGFEVNT